MKTIYSDYEYLERKPIREEITFKRKSWNLNINTPKSCDSTKQKSNKQRSKFLRNQRRQKEEDMYLNLSFYPTTQRKPKYKKLYTPKIRKIRKFNYPKPSRYNRNNNKRNNTLSSTNGRISNISYKRERSFNRSNYRNSRVNRTLVLDRRRTRRSYNDNRYNSYLNKDLDISPSPYQRNDTCDYKKVVEILRKKNESNKIDSVNEDKMEKDIPNQEYDDISIDTIEYDDWCIPTYIISENNNWNSDENNENILPINDKENNNLNNNQTCRIETLYQHPTSLILPIIGE